MPKINLTKGVATKIKNGKKVNVDAIDVPEYDDCCKLDCCTGGLFTKDIATGEKVVIWVENGSVLTDTIANFEAAVKGYE